jgi:FMN-dependent NADH-azoreductase
MWCYRPVPHGEGKVTDFDALGHQSDWVIKRGASHEQYSLRDEQPPRRRLVLQPRRRTRPRRARAGASRSDGGRAGRCARSLPHVDEDFVAALRSPEGPRTARQHDIIAKSDSLIDELLAADIIVIAAPMYNFGIPSTLKAWIDYVARAGRTFRYTEKGPEGLVKGKKVILIHSRGGIYSSGPAQAMDHQGTYLRSVLGFLGITDIESIDVEGVAYGLDAAEKAVAQGIARAHTLIDTRAAA